MCGFSGGMMGSTPRGYHLSQLTCWAPSSLPGTTVYVMVGDMGMTTAMGGDAPLGQHMMLRAVPAQVASDQVSFVVGNMGWRTHELVLLPLGPGQNAGERLPARMERWMRLAAWVRRRHRVPPARVRASSPARSGG